MGLGRVQGAGLGLLFVPLSAASLATLSAERRTEGAGIYNLSRNIVFKTSARRGDGHAVVEV